MADRVLVTGGAGFIGSHIVDQFIEAGHDCFVIDNLSSGRRAHLNPAANFYQVDVRDAEALQRVVKQVRPTILCHQAALANVRESLSDPVGYVQGNVIGTINLLEAVRQYPVRRVLFASTGGAIYGELSDLPGTEQSPTRPLDPYGTSKLAAEHYGRVYEHNFALPFCALRYPNVYGPRQDPFGEGGVVAIFAYRMLKGQPTLINGDGLQSRDFTYVGDIARANVLAAEKGQGVLNLGTGRGVTIRELHAIMARLTSYPNEPAFGPAKAGEVRHSYLSAERARQQLGWEPHVTLEDGLRETLAFFRQSEPLAGSN